MEQDKAVSGNGNSYTTQFRQYDPRLGRWKSLDPLAAKYASVSPYNGMGNNPLFHTDPLGLEPSGDKDKKGDGDKDKKGNGFMKKKGKDGNITEKDIHYQIDEKTVGYKQTWWEKNVKNPLKRAARKRAAKKSESSPVESSSGEEDSDNSDKMGVGDPKVEKQESSWSNSKVYESTADPVLAIYRYALQFHYWMQSVPDVDWTGNTKGSSNKDNFGNAGGLHFIVKGKEGYGPAISGSNAVPTDGNIMPGTTAGRSGPRGNTDTWHAKVPLGKSPLPSKLGWWLPKPGGYNNPSNSASNLNKIGKDQKPTLSIGNDSVVVRNYSYMTQKTNYYYKRVRFDNEKRDTIPESSNK